MKCKDIKDLIGPYLYGDLSPEEMRAVRTHAQLCEVCSEDISSRGALIGALANRAPELTDDERQRIAWSVKGAIRAKEREKSLFGFRFTPAYGLAAVVIVGMVAIKVVGSMSAREVAHTTPGVKPAAIAKKVQTPESPKHVLENNGTRENSSNTAAVPNDTGDKAPSSSGIAGMADTARGMLTTGLVDRHKKHKPPARTFPEAPTPMLNPLGTPDVELDNKGETKLPEPTGSNDVQVTPSEKNGANGSE